MVFNLPQGLMLVGILKQFLLFDKKDVEVFPAL
uniref:Uncharacterized protein n=1 Tax=Anguilla anguilla TaxID=7936 RepID=A0A0E9XSR8_ANGAN